jgi:hypothetical protein
VTRSRGARIQCARESASAPAGLGIADDNVEDLIETATAVNSHTMSPHLACSNLIASFLTP